MYEVNTIYNISTLFLHEIDHDLISTKYTVEFNYITKTFICNNHVCHGSLFLDDKCIFFSSEDNIIIFTRGALAWSKQGLHMRAEGIFDLKQKKIITRRDTDIKLIKQLLYKLKRYSSKNKQLFETYINNTTCKRDVVVYHSPHHIGHDIVNEILHWNTLLKITNTLKVIGACLFFSKQQLIKIFSNTEVYKNDEELFIDTCTNKYLLCRVRQTIGTNFDNTFITPLIKNQDNLNEQITVGLFLKEDNMYRNCLNCFEFYSKIIEILNKFNFKIKIFGYIQLHLPDKMYKHSIERCQIVGENLLTHNNVNNNIEFFNNVNIDEFMQHVAQLSYYITLPGSIQHLVHLFSINLKKGLVFGDNISFLDVYKNLMNYESMPSEFLEYYDLNNNILINPRSVKPRCYNIKVKNLESVQEYLLEFFK